MTLRRNAFLRLLKLELRRAARYNFLASVMLLRIDPEVVGGNVTELPRALARTVRSTDVLGSLGSGMIGLIVPHADRQTAHRLLARLCLDSPIAALIQRTGASIQLGFGIYPTDATTLSGLLSVAFKRLETNHAVQADNA